MYRLHDCYGGHHVVADPNDEARVFAGFDCIGRGRPKHSDTAFSKTESDRATRLAVGRSNVFHVNRLKRLVSHKNMFAFDHDAV